MSLVAKRKRELYYGGDNLAVMRGLDSGMVDLIYLDPPFNSKSFYRGAMNSVSEKHQFKDTWKMSDINADELNDLKACAFNVHHLISTLGVIHGETWQAYLTFMSVRLLEMRRLLKDTGSIYLHCDATMSHPLKLIMDCIFGARNFRNEIAWCYTGPGNTKRYFPRKHDRLLYYVKSESEPYCFNGDEVRIPYAKLKTGKTKGIFKSEATLNKQGKIPEDWWEESRDGMTPVGRIKEERVGWATQKPLSLLNRIIKVSSNKGDLVLDPFCGCTTACVAAENLGRAWIGIDIDKESKKILLHRAKRESESLLACKMINASKTKLLPVCPEVQEAKIPRSEWNQVNALLYREQKEEYLT